MTTDPKTLDDDALQRLDGAVGTECDRRRHLADPNIAAALASLSEDELYALEDSVESELMLRSDRNLLLGAAHAIEQGEAQEQANSHDERAKLVHRSARLFKLARLGAPPCIISQALQQVNKWKPEE